MANVLKKGRINRPYHDLLEQHKADQIIINNLKTERNILQTCMDAQSHEINFLNRQVNGYALFISNQDRKRRLKNV